jgi:hypothetical protein
MKRFVLIAGLLLIVAFQSPLEAKAKPKKETAADLSAAKTIFLGWVDLSPEEWSVWGYSNKEEWVNVIKDLNLDFQSSCQGKYLAGRTVTAAKDSSDENTTGKDLYIKFSDVHIDHETYGIRLAIHFIDPKTNTEIASIPTRLYSEKRWFKFQLYMRAALDDVGEKIQVDVTGAAPKK